jgi:hypothetical protein
VSSDADGGLNTLRWAIRRANERVGPDTITFTAEMATRTIAITSVLPSLTDGSLTIDGDLDDDAAGDGKVDDSAALQKALDQIRPADGKHPRVLYIPAGTYRITATLNLIREGGSASRRAAWTPRASPRRPFSGAGSFAAEPPPAAQEAIPPAPPLPSPTLPALRVPAA